ncbi:MAG: CBS domain-containing protein, partial [Trebonia sp.]
DVLTFEADLSAADALRSISDTDPSTVAYRRQMLYPVLGEKDRLRAVVTRTLLETAVHSGQGSLQLTQLGISTPIVTHSDHTLRTVAVQMAANEVDKMPVVDRDDPTRVVGMITLTMLLAGRLKDLQEARDTERILRLRVVRPRWRTVRSGDGAASDG